MPKRKRDGKVDNNFEEVMKRIGKLESKMDDDQPRRVSRRRIISDSESIPTDSENEFNSSSNEAVNAKNPVVQDPNLIMEKSQDIELDSEILMLLGDAPKPETKFGKATHNDLAKRWQEVLDKGLPKEVKDKISQEYLIPENCNLLVAPSLNPEVKAALAESMVKRDFSLLNKQKQLGTAIAAVNQAIELSLTKESYTKIIKCLSDACRLLCDSHYSDTNTRRGFVLSAINNDIKETLTETKRDQLLFGDNISEKLKAAKTVKKSGIELKQVRNEKHHVFNKNNFRKTKAGANNNRLNWKTLPRKNVARFEAGRTRQGPRAAPNHGSQQREAPRQSSRLNNRRR